MGGFVLLLAASAGLSVGKVQLLSGHLGLAVVSAPTQRLLATDSGGRETQDVGPRLPRFSNIDDFSFRDRRHGWVVRWNLNNVGVSVYRTNDGGRSWKHVDVTAHSMAAGSVATIQFLDLKHGWLVNQQPTAPDAELYATLDGGARWQLVRRRLPEIAPVLFTGVRDAWQAGGPFGRSLFHSTDGGRTWRETRVPLPSDTRRALYSPPAVFGGRVLDAVSLVRAGGVELRIYGRADHGRTWKLEGTLNLPGTSTDNCPLFATRAPPSVAFLTRRTWWAVGYHSGGWHMYSTKDSGRHWRSRPITRVPAPASCAQAPSLQAVNTETAWFRFTVGERDGRLYATHDGGSHWRPLLLNMP